MYNDTLGHRILEKLDEAFPRKLHLHELRAALPEYGSLPPHEWLLAVEALKVEGKLDGKFLQDGTSIADAAALFITTFGRLYLRGPEGRKPAEPANRALDDQAFAQLAIDEARKSVSEDARTHPKVGAVVVKNGKVLGQRTGARFPDATPSTLRWRKSCQTWRWLGQPYTRLLSPALPEIIRKFLARRGSWSGRWRAWSSECLTLTQPSGDAGNSD